VARQRLLRVVAQRPLRRRLRVLVGSGSQVTPT